MNKLAHAGAVLVLVVPLSALPQTPPPAPAPKQPPATTPAAAPAKAPAASAAPAVAAASADGSTQKAAKRTRHRVPSKADARVCLEFPTTMQIIKCSEKYRWAS